MNLTNHFLIATANLDRSVFADSVIFICRHDSDGAFGLVLNKPSNTSVRELLESLKIPPAGGSSAVLHGGPVKPEQVFILHSPPGEYDVTIRVDDNIGVTMSKDILSAIAENRAPKKCNSPSAMPVGIPSSWNRKSARTHGLPFPPAPTLFLTCRRPAPVGGRPPDGV